MTRQRILQALAITSAPPFDPEDFLPATQEEKEQIDQMNEATTYWKDAWRRLKKNKIAMGALVAIIALILFAVVGPFFSPYSYSQQIRGSESLAPSLAHPFGTDNLGRDLLVRTMIGCRISLAVGLVSSLIVLLIGSTYGAISGLAGGLTDNIMIGGRKDNIAELQIIGFLHTDGGPSQKSLDLHNEKSGGEGLYEIVVSAEHIAAHLV